MKKRITSQEDSKANCEDQWVLHAKQREWDPPRGASHDCQSWDGGGVWFLRLGPDRHRSGTHSPWVSRLLQKLGHEMVVANPKRVRLITESSRKDDRLDAQTLAGLARIDPQLLRPIQHRSEKAQRALMIIRVRAALMGVRTNLVNSAGSGEVDGANDYQSVMRTRWEFSKLGHCRRSSDRCWNHC